MKKTYQELEMEFILLDACDILTLSVGKNAAGEDDGIVIKNLNDLISGN